MPFSNALIKEEPIKKQRGAALITALVIITLVTIIATTMAYDLHLLIKRHSSRLHIIKSDYVLLGSELVAKQKLQDIIQTDTPADGSDHYTIDETFVIHLDNNTSKITGKIIDLQGLFNINSLAQVAPNNKPIPNNINQTQFIRLLLTLNEQITLDDALAITEAVIDWIDPDDSVTGNGAETDYYAQLNSPYLPANRLLSYPEELLQVRYMTKDLFLLLQPHIVALPTQKNLINTNTATINILRTLDSSSNLEPLTEQEVLPLLEERDTKRFKNRQDISLPSVWSSDKPLANVTFNSEWFEYQGILTEGHIGRKISSTLHQEYDTKKMNVINRTLSYY